MKYAADAPPPAPTVEYKSGRQQRQRFVFDAVSAAFPVCFLVNCASHGASEERSLRQKANELESVKPNIN